MASVLVRIRSIFDGRGTRAARQAAGQVNDAFGQLTKVAGALGLAFGVKELIDFSVETFQAGEKARVAAVAFDSLSGSAGIARLNLQAMDRATKGLISDTEQMQIANQLLGMKIANTDAELEKVVGVSRRLGKTFKELGTKEAAEEFAIMISNMSVARLDSFGISSGAVRKRIDELMASTEGMTREQAFFQATMEEADETLARLGPEVATTADEISRLGAEWGNLQVAIGQTVAGSGIVKEFFTGMADDLVRLNAHFDDTPENRIAALNVELEREQERLETLKSRGESYLGIFASQVPGAQQNIKDLESELNNLLQVQGELDRRGQADQAKQNAAIRAEEIAAENAAKEKARTETLAKVQEEFSRDIVDLQDKTQEQLASAKDRFRDDELSAEEGHQDRLLDIQEKSAKDRVKLQKRFEKDNTKIGKDLQKNLIELEKDQAKQAKKLQEESGKKEAVDRKRSKIDALADERLFQFSLRQMEAEGDGIAIRDALERRAIEQEIAAEKAEFEKSVEKEKRDDQIKSLRDEGAERRAQLEQQAAERRADLAERNQEEIASLDERITEEIAEENEGFAKKQEDLARHYDDKISEIREGEAEGVAEIAKALVEAEELTNTQLDKMVALAGQFGTDFGQRFADGMTEAISENLKIESAIAAASTGQLGLGGSGLPSTGGGGSSQGGIGIFQGGGVAQQTGPAILHQGEVVANPNAGQAIVIGGEQFAVFEAERLAAAINGQRQRDMQSLVDTLAENLG